MHRFNFYLPIELYDRIKLMAKFYGISTTKMMIQLLEISYIKMLDSKKRNMSFMDSYFFYNLPD